MSHLTNTTITRIPLRSESWRDEPWIEVYANGNRLAIETSTLYPISLHREEALLLVEAITARLAEVTEGQ